MELNEITLGYIENNMPGYFSLYKYENGQAKCIFFSSNLPAFASMTFDEYNEIVSHDAFDIVVPSDREKLKKDVNEKFSKGQSIDTFYRTIEKVNGNDWVHMRAGVIGTIDGNPVFLASYINASEELDMYQIILDNSNSNIYVIDIHTDELLYANKTGLKRLGKQDVPYCGKTCYQFIRDRGEKCSQCLKGKLKNGELYEETRYNSDTDIYERVAGELITWCGHDAFVQYVDDITESEKLKMDLESSRLKYQLAVDGADLGVWEFDIAAKKLTVSDKFFSVHKIHIQQKDMRSAIIDLVLGSEKNKAAAILDDIESGRVSSESEVWLEGADDFGQQCVKITYSVVHEKEGDAGVAVGIIQNITAQKLEEQKFRRTLSEMLSVNPDALCSYHADITDDKCLESHGVSEFINDMIRSDTVSGLCANIEKIITDERDRKLFHKKVNRNELLAKFNEGITHLSLDYRRKSDDGTAHWVTTFVNMLQNPANGHIEGILYSLDINETKTEDMIFMALTERTYDYLALINTQSRKLRFYSMSKRTEGHIFFTDDKDYDSSMTLASESEIEVSDPDEYRQAMNLDKVTKELSDSPEYTYSYTLGKTSDQRKKLVSFRYLDDTHEYIFFTRTDVTDAFMQQQIQTDRISNALETAQKANQMKSDFLGNVSHDMRTPLNAVLGYTDLALRSDDSVEIHDYLKKIRRSGGILLQLISDTLDLSKIESGKITLKPEVISCGEMMTRIVTIVKPSMDEKHIKFTIDNSRAVMANICIDVTRVQEILLNILSNAVKYTPEYGEITLTVECEKLDPDKVHDRITVTDNGIGMTPEFIDKIFEPFAQERLKGYENIEGSGLGMSIVKRIVDMMGGTVEVSSELGKGTTVTVCLGFERADEDSTSTEENESKKVRLRGRNILVAEDNDMNTEIAKAVLEMEGMTVQCVKNGQEAVDAFSSAPEGTFDAVLMDIRMPIKNGYEAVREIRSLGRQDAKTVPIIAMSADAYADDVKRCLDSGMNSHVSKPIDPSLLYSRLSEFIK